MRRIKDNNSPVLRAFSETEFIRKNRFLITYPEELGLDEWVTYSSTPIESDNEGDMDNQ